MEHYDAALDVFKNPPKLILAYSTLAYEMYSIALMFSAVLRGARPSDYKLVGVRPRRQFSLEDSGKILSLIILE